MKVSQLVIMAGGPRRPSARWAAAGGGVGGVPELGHQQGDHGQWPAALVAVGRYLQLSDDQIIYSHLFMCHMIRCAQVVQNSRRRLACFRRSSPRRSYFCVVVTLAWPIASLTVIMSSPLSNMADAKVLRRS